MHARPCSPGTTSRHLPRDLGFYDLRVPETRVEQAALARATVIHGFCYYYYWFNGRRLLERPLDEVHRSGEPDFPFCVCWANEHWTRRWDGSDDTVLMAQEYTPEADRRLISDLASLLRDPRYIRVDGRPLLVVYRASALPDPRAFAERAREQAKREGLGDLFLACMLRPAHRRRCNWASTPQWNSRRTAWRRARSRLPSSSTRRISR